MKLTPAAREHLETRKGVLLRLLSMNRAARRQRKFRKQEAFYRAEFARVMAMLDEDAG